MQILRHPTVCVKFMQRLEARFFREKENPAVFVAMDFPLTRNTTLSSSSLTLASILLLMLQPVLFFSQVLINPTAHIPFDIEGYHLPLISYMAQCARRGVAPLWDPYPYCGVPIHADVTAALFYPFTWLAILLGNHTNGQKLFYWVEFLVPLHMALAGVFTFLLLRRIGLRRPAALLGASVYQLGGYFASQAQHLGAICAGAWLPLAILAVWELRLRARLRWMAILAIAVAMGFLSGYAASTLVIAGAIGLTTAVLLAFRQASWRILPGVAAGCLGGAVISAVELVPLWQLTHLSIAAIRGVAEGLGGGMTWQAMVSFVVPNYYHIFDLSNYHLPYNFTFMYVYCGLATVVLLVLALFVRESLVRIFLLLTLLSAVWMLGEHTPFYRLLFPHLPRLLRDALYAEFALMAFCFFAGITAALVLDRLGKRAPQVVLWALALLASFDLIHTGRQRPMNSFPGGYQVENSEYRIRGTPNLLWELQGLVGRAFPPSRIDYTDNRFEAGFHGSELFRLPTPNGDNPFLLERVWRLRFLYATARPWERQLSVNHIDSPLLRMLNVGWLASYSELPRDQVERAGLQLHGLSNGLWVYENPRALRRFFLVPHIRRSTGEMETLRLLADPAFDPAREAIVEGIPGDRDLTGAGSVSVKGYGANRIHLVVNAEGPSYLVTSETMYPGWQAIVNGRAENLQMTNGAFRGLSLSAGISDIVMEYHPPYLTLWMVVSLISFLAAAAGAIFDGRILRKTKRSQPVPLPAG
jgi:membrane protein YfhO